MFTKHEAMISIVGLGFLSMKGVGALQIVEPCTVDAGGIVGAVGGQFSLNGTIGQPDAAGMFGGEFVLNSAFWIEIVPGDCNSDGGVGLLDVGTLNNCMGGPVGENIRVNCSCFDFNDDGNVDLLDFAGLQMLWYSP